MKKIALVTLTLAIMAFTGRAQERFGHTLNLGVGVGGYAGYYQHSGRSMSIFNINYEIGVAQHFTLAPFVTFYSYHHDYYRETVVPIGVKGTFYFDRILNARPNWDFYLAGSLGATYVRSTWDENYLGNRDYYNRAPLLFFDVHIGAEYKFSNRLGMFLDLSSGVSTIGLAFHL
jgi:hypothetical protein